MRPSPRPTLLSGLLEQFFSDFKWEWLWRRDRGARESFTGYFVWQGLWAYCWHLWNSHVIRPGTGNAGHLAHPFPRSLKIPYVKFKRKGESQGNLGANETFPSHYGGKHLEDTRVSQLLRLLGHGPNCGQRRTGPPLVSNGERLSHSWVQEILVLTCMLARAHETPCNESALGCVVVGIW